MSRITSPSWCEVTELIARLAHAMDSGPTVAALTEHFAPDAVMTFPANPRTGPTELRLAGREAISTWVSERRAAGHQGPSSGTRHVVSTTVVNDTGPESARAASYFCFYGASDAGPVLKAVGTYFDDLTRIDGRWLVVARTVAV